MPNSRGLNRIPGARPREERIKGMEPGGQAPGRKDKENLKYL